MVVSRGPGCLFSPLVPRLGAMFLALGLAALAPQGASAQVMPDKTVAKLLKKAGMGYQVDSDGDFRVVYSVGEERTQLAIIRSATESYGDVTIREIWSPAQDSGEPFPQDVANELLADNARRKIGAWEVQTYEDAHVAVFNAKVPAKLSVKELLAYMEMVVSTADEMEERLNGGDNF